MSNLKEIRMRIASVSSTQKITGAMKLVSAAKLRKAQNAILVLRPYANKFNEILQRISSGEANFENPILKKREIKNVIIVVFSSNRGLCGSFNSNIVKEVNSLIFNNYQQQYKKGQLKLICIGKKAYEQLNKSYEILHYDDSLIENASFENISEITEMLIKNYISNKADKIEIVYNKFLNSATQKLEIETLLPVNSLKSDSTKIKNIDFLYDTSKAELLDALIPKMLKLKMFKALTDSVASEHGARMTAMAKATDNAAEILKTLKLKYNNARQSAITTELLEIISGANALDN